MNRYFRYLITCFSVVLFLFGCSTAKNTWLSRNTNSFTTYYNIYFNGYESYKAGIDNINQAQKDNYLQLIPMYPISNHKNATAGSAKMNIAIEKCRKCIKLKSIKAKPKKNFDKKNDPQYIAFMSKEEYNPMVLKAWLLLASAEFYKADFLGAMGTYAYIVKHFCTESDLVNEAQIGRARCFTEMGWLYEAEEALNKVSTKTTLNATVNGHYAAADANLLIKEKKYAEALPFLKTAIDDESNSFLKARFNFVLGQLSTLLDDKTTAYNAYTAVIKKGTVSEMVFAARLQRAQVAGEKTDQVLKELEKMARSPQNKNYVDAIYVAIGNTYLQDNKKDKAIENYNKAIHSKMPDSFDKMAANIKLGDLYYADKEFLKAQPCYAAAAKSIKSENDDFDRVTKRAEVLNELTGYSNTVILQDSLQAIAKLSEKERLVAIDKIIERVKKTDQDAAKALALAQQQQQLQAQQQLNNGFLPVGGQQNTATSSSWYFYNPTTVASGVAQFQQTWGTRKLEDDWRRTDKISIAENLQSAMETSSAGKDSLKTKSINDKYKPSYYIAQLPLTQSDMNKSNLMIGKSLLCMGQIYENKLEDMPTAIKTYDELYRRFGVDSLWIDACYSLYNLNAKANNMSNAEKYKNIITSNFPNTAYAAILGHPEYALHQREILLLQDSLYEASFNAYTRNDFQTVMNNYKYMSLTYPISSLMPKFAFLNALSVGKNGDQEAMKESLANLIKKYPQSDVCSTAKDILALMGQGKTVVKGGGYGNLITQQQQELEQQSNKPAPPFSAILNNLHCLLLPIVSDTIDINKVLYKVANFNFSRFVLKDFDMDVRRQATGLRFIVISDFPSFADARHYQDALAEDPALLKILREAGIMPLPISEDNLKALQLGQSFRAYREFYENTLIPAQAEGDNKK